MRAQFAAIPAAFPERVSTVREYLQKYRVRLKKHTATWSATANTLFDYGRNSDVVKWTRDCESYPDLSTRDLIPVVASRWELYQFRAARLAWNMVYLCPRTATHRLLARLGSLDALLLRKFDEALDHARNIAVRIYTVGIS